MTRRWPTYLLIAGLFVLLAVLGVLQYRWMKQISESDGEKARAQVKDNAERFAADFNREIQNAYFNFQTGSEVFKQRDWAAFNERYDYWRANAAYPGLITGFYFVGAKNDAGDWRYDVAAKQFSPAPDSPELAAIKASVADERNFDPVDVRSMTLYLPIHDMDHPIPRARVMLRAPVPDQVPPDLPPRHGFLAIKLDPVTVRDGILADLDKKYFGDGEYSAAVTDNVGNAVFHAMSGQADASAPLFDLAPNNIIFYANKDLMRSIDGEKRGDVMINQRIERRGATRIETVTGEGPANDVLKVEVRNEAKPRTSIFTATTRGAESGGPWTLAVQHASGSLDAHIASILRRNLAIGFGILFLLAASIGAIIVSSLRVRRFAQRQLDFVSSVSHEFRTPLAVIYSAGENLADGVAKEDSQVAKYGDLIRGEGRKLSAMVEQILEFAGARSGRRKFSFGQAQVSDVIGSALSDCQSLIDERGIEVETSIPENLPQINADASALSHALQNLIANSIKYGNGNAWLRISASNGGGKIKIAVEDRGIGIAKSDMRQIFEPFYRSKEVVDAQLHGNGLGLSLVKQIVDAHAGTVTAESEIGKGSKFVIELPQE